MDFAAEPVLDAFTTPPRAASRPASSGDNAPTFDEHLDAVNEAAPESAASQRVETKSDAPSAETKPGPDAVAETRDTTDTALLGGPLPAPPVIAARLVIQIAAAQPAQTQTQPIEASAPVLAPVAAPQAPAPSAPVIEAAPAELSAPVAPTEGQSAAETKNIPTATTPMSAQATPQAPSAPVQTAHAPNAAPQAIALTTTAAAIAIEQPPAAVQQVIAATITPAPQVITEATQRALKATAKMGEAIAAPETNAAKTTTPAPNTNAKTHTAKAAPASAVTTEAASAAPAQSSDSDTQTGQTPAIAATASQASTHTQQVAVDAGAQRTAPAAAQVAREIVRRFDGGSTSFEFRLDPPELGRVEVRMEVSRDHRVTAVISADSPQALTELARHARELEAQLQSAGLQLSDNGLSFDLRQNAGGGEAQNASDTQSAKRGEEALTEQPPPTARPIGFERWRGVRVDMMV